MIDGIDLEIGSLSYTTAAITHNGENSFVLWNVPRIANTYAIEQDRLRRKSKR